MRFGCDPATSPVVDRFRVFKKTNRIKWYDFVDGDYVDDAKVHSVGGR